MKATTRGPFGAARPISIGDLDAAITTTIGKPVRADRLARDDRVFRWACRRAIATGSLSFRTTYAQAAAGAGYEVPTLNCRQNRLQARSQRVSTVYRALQSLQSAGLLRFHGYKNDRGQWVCLRVKILPSAFSGPLPCGRSPRRVERLPGNRVRFLRRNGTSPTVGKPNLRPSECIRARASAQAHQTAQQIASEKPGSMANDMLEALEALARRTRPPSTTCGWHLERWDLSDYEAVELVEHFEAEWGFEAKFSFSRHGEQLRRILARIDRYAWVDPQLAGPRAGYRYAWAMVRRWGRLYRAGNQKVAHVNSLPYFLPKLDQHSKQLRRRARQLQREDEHAEGR